MPGEDQEEKIRNGFDPFDIKPYMIPSTNTGQTIFWQIYLRQLNRENLILNLNKWSESEWWRVADR